MKVGDLVKHRFRTQSLVEEGLEGVGLVMNISNTTPVFENRHATVMWGATSTTQLHRFALLEVISESR